ncbi:MAG: hypothetical protein KAR31_04025, partial [Candidatus Omnitrophica bacterium]|nr:hypothetical protein [Candidatus Omnitrophota bacterium]
MAENKEGYLDVITLKGNIYETGVKTDDENAVTEALREAVIAQQAIEQLSKGSSPIKTNSHSPVSHREERKTSGLLLEKLFEKTVRLDIRFEEKRKEVAKRLAFFVTTLFDEGSENYNKAVFEIRHLAIGYALGTREVFNPQERVEYEEKKARREKLIVPAIIGGLLVNIFAISSLFIWGLTSVHLVFFALEFTAAMVVGDCVERPMTGERGTVPKAASWTSRFMTIESIDDEQAFSHELGHTIGRIFNSKDPRHTMGRATEVVFKRPDLLRKKERELRYSDDEYEEYMKGMRLGEAYSKGELSGRKLAEIIRFRIGIKNSLSAYIKDIARRRCEAEDHVSGAYLGGVAVSLGKKDLRRSARALLDMYFSLSNSPIEKKLSSSPVKRVARGIGSSIQINAPNCLVRFISQIIRRVSQFTLFIFLSIAIAVLVPARAIADDAGKRVDLKFNRGGVEVSVPKQDSYLRFDPSDVIKEYQEKKELDLKAFRFGYGREWDINERGLKLNTRGTVNPNGEYEVYMEIRTPFKST